MSTKRFNRKFELTIIVDGKSILIKDPIRIVFSADKSIFGSLNKMNILIYNLNRSSRLALVKDKEEKKDIGISLKVGYDDKVELIYSGSVQVGYNEKQGADIVTGIESHDGLIDYLFAYTSKTIGKGGNVQQAVIDDMPNTATGVISKKDALTRPKVVVGNSYTELEKSLNPDETMYIDNGVINIIKVDEAIRLTTTVVNAETGLKSTPTRENQKVTFETVLNPAVKIGHLIKLESKTAPHLDGVYKVDTINYEGDNYGQDWTQTATGRLFNNKVR